MYGVKKDMQDNRNKIIIYSAINFIISVGNDVKIVLGKVLWRIN